MRVDFAFICDYAQVTGKINALGIGFDTIYAPKIPFKYPHISLVMQLRASVVEAGQKNVEVHLIDADGRDIMPSLRRQFTIRRREGATETIGRFVMEFGNVEFAQYGSYSLHIAVEGIEVVQIPFKVAQPLSPTTD